MDMDLNSTNMSGTMNLGKKLLILELWERQNWKYALQDKSIKYFIPYQYSSYNLWDKQYRSRQIEWAKNWLICALALLQLKYKQLKMVISGILPTNKGKSFRRKKLIKTNNMLQYKCSQMPNVTYQRQAR